MTEDLKTYGILFDYNGVIVDDEALQEAAMAGVVAQYGVVLTHELYEAHLVGRSDTHGATFLTQQFPQLKGVSVPQLLTAKMAAYRELISKQSIVYPGLAALLDQLAPEFRMAIVTGSLREEMLPVIQAAGIDRYFKEIITANDITRSKPDPEGYLKGLAALGLPAENVVVLEDSSSGVAAAKAANITCVAVLHSHPREMLTQADYITPRVIDVTPDILKNLLQKKVPH